MPIEYRLPNGGYRWHLVDTAAAKALCGYAPRSRHARMMKDRTGWSVIRTTPPDTDKCEACMLRYLRLKQRDIPHAEV